MHKFAEDIMKCVKSKVEARGIDNVSYEEAKEIGEWVDIAKDIVCYDKDMRIIEQMDEEDEMHGRMGYRGRDSRGRFVHRPGRGRSAGYSPMIHMPYLDGEWGKEEEYPNSEYYRMGYPMSSMPYKKSKYGESYDRYDEYRKYYHDSKDAESKKQMEESMKEYAEDFAENLKEMWKDAEPQMRQQLKADMTRLIQQLQ